MIISITDFMGEFPMKHPRLLPPNAAQLAVNTRLDDGAITPLSGSTFTTDLTTPRKAVYLNGSTWLAWSDHVHVVPGPVASDRLYITGDGVPKMYVNDLYYPLALPAPVSAPITATTTAPDEDNLETVVFAYTYVTEFGEESAPSPVSDGLSTSEGVTVRLSGMALPPINRGINKMRIYRSVTSDLAVTDLYFVAEIVPAVTFDHDQETYPIAEPISTTNFTPPPDDLRGIISMPNGMMVGHTTRDIWFCEPYQPHAWPVSYSLTVDYDIVGLAAFGSQLAVMTKGQPYRGQGSEPDTFQLERVEENLPCVSARGIVDLGYAAAYPSTEGLVLVSGNSTNLVTRQLFNRREWARMQPETMVASQVGGRYVFAFDGTLSGATEKTGIIDLTGAQPFFMRTDAVMKCGYHDIRTGRLYMQEADNRLYIFDDTASEAYRAQEWKTKLHDLPFPVSFSGALIEGDNLTGANDFQVTFIADGVEIHTATTLNQIFRLPDVSAQHWEVYVTGTASISSITFATSLAELSRRP